MSASPDELAAALARLAVPLGVAEAQGLACGLLCSHPASAAKSRWFGELLDAATLAPEALAAHADDLRALDGWFADTLAALNDAELDFALAMPTDEAPLGRRLDALGEFCAGFVYGIGIGLAGRAGRTLPADTRELLEDFSAIDGAELDADDADGENAFAELVEYVRVGVLLIHEELKPVSDGARGAAARGVSESEASTPGTAVH